MPGWSSAGSPWRSSLPRLRCPTIRQRLPPCPSVDEARGRARLLHGTIHDTLQFVHAQDYRVGEGLMIPAAGLERVFRGDGRTNDVKLRWLAVDGRAMNIDHNPRDEFEEEASKSLASGKDEHELVADGVYRYAAPITLRAECLKCHFPAGPATRAEWPGSRSRSRSRSSSRCVAPGLRPAPLAMGNGRSPIIVHSGGVVIVEGFDRFLSRPRHSRDESHDGLHGHPDRRRQRAGRRGARQAERRR